MNALPHPTIQIHIQECNHAYMTCIAERERERALAEEVQRRHRCRQHLYTTLSRVSTRPYESYRSRLAFVAMQFSQRQRQPDASREMFEIGQRLNRYDPQHPANRRRVQQRPPAAGGPGGPIVVVAVFVPSGNTVRTSSRTARRHH